MPCSYTWVQGVMEVDGRFSSWYWCGFFVGFMAVPATMGYIFEYHTPLGMPVVGLVCALFMSLILVVILLFPVVYKLRFGIGGNVGDQDEEKTQSP